MLGIFKIDKIVFFKELFGIVWLMLDWYFGYMFFGFDSLSYMGGWKVWIKIIILWLGRDSDRVGEIVDIEFNVYLKYLVEIIFKLNGENNDELLLEIN